MYYVLDENRNPVAVGYDEWIAWMKRANRLVARTVTEVDLGRGPEKIVISTVFLGIDHALPKEPDRQLFETLVMDSGYRDIEIDRYASWDEAEKGHRKILAKYRSL